MTIHDWQNAMDRAVRQEKQSYSGMMMPQIHAVVDNVLDLSRIERDNKADEEFACDLMVECAKRDPWGRLARAQTWICGGKESMHSRYPYMSKGDVQAWYLLNDLKEIFESKVSQTCMAIIPTNSIATEGSPCGELAVGNTEMCAKHLAESGI